MIEFVKKLDTLQFFCGFMIMIEFVKKLDTLQFFCGFIMVEFVKKKNRHTAVFLWIHDNDKEFVKKK